MDAFTLVVVVTALVVGPTALLIAAFALFAWLADDVRIVAVRGDVSAQNYAGDTGVPGE